MPWVFAVIQQLYPGDISNDMSTCDPAGRKRSISDDMTARLHNGPGFAVIQQLYPGAISRDMSTCDPARWIYRKARENQSAVSD
eukprot:g61180.t1